MLKANTTLNEKIKSTGARWNPLKKVDTLGQFYFTTGIVALDSLQAYHVQGVTLDDLKSTEKIDLPTYGKLVKSLTLAVHEYTHFVDCTSTLWGLKHLQSLNRAYSCDLKKVSELHLMRSFYTHLKRIKLPDYYTTVDKSVDASRPWQARHTSGREFRHDGTPSERPIFFIRFFNKDMQPITRTPLSTVSLLETCAMAEELRTHSSLLMRIEDAGERAVQTRIFEKQTFDYLYNSELTEYSACAHLVANRFNCEEANRAFWASSIIARIALNSSAKTYKSIIKGIRILFDKIRISHNDPEAKAIRKGLQNNDPGVLFYVLCLSMDKDSLVSMVSFTLSLALTMRRYDIHLERDREKSTIEEAKPIFEELKKSPLGTVLKLAEAGFENLENMTGSFGMINLHEMNLPPVLLGDDSTYQFQNTPSNRLQDLDVEASFYEMVERQIHMENFGDACI